MLNFLPGMSIYHMHITCYLFQKYTKEKKMFVMEIKEQKEEKNQVLSILPSKVFYR